MTVTTYPEDDGDGHALETRSEFLVDPADGRKKRWLSLGFVTAGRLKLTPADDWQGVRVYWQLPWSRSANDAMSEELYQLMQTARSLEDIARRHRAKRSYPLDTHRPTMTGVYDTYYIGLLTSDTYIVTDRHRGGQELWVQGWRKPDDLLIRPKFTPGQSALAGELLRLPPYNDDARNVTAIVDGISGFSDEVLEAVATRLRVLIRARLLKVRPDLDDIRQMCAKALKEVAATARPDSRVTITRPFR